jgi:hypothetical protein
MVGWMDGVQMRKLDRRIAEAYLRKTEAVFDLIWLAGTRIRGVFARSPGQSYAGRDGVEQAGAGRDPSAVRVGVSGGKNSTCLKP